MANTEKKQALTMLSPKVRLSYPKLIKAEPYKDPVTGNAQGAPVFNTEMLCPDDNISMFRIWDENIGDWVYDHIHNFCVQVAKDKFGSDFNVNEAIKHDGISWPVQSSSKYISERIAKSGGRLDEEKLAHYVGNFIVKSKALSEINSRPFAPTLSYYNENKERVSVARGTDKGEQLAASMFYGGAWAVLELSAVAGTVGANKYVTLYINHVIFIGHDDKFGGGPRLMDRFEGVTGGNSDYDPTEGMDNEIDI